METQDHKDLKVSKVFKEQVVYQELQEIQETLEALDDQEQLV